MAAPVRTISIQNIRAANAWLINHGFQRLAGCWMTSNNWAQVIPLSRGRASFEVGVTT